MKTVLISIQPKWAELIAKGKKTIEVRKTRPKLETPFKCYIYCTMAKKDFNFYLCRDSEGIGLLHATNYKQKERLGFEGLSGKVIGEFICDRVTKIYSYNKGYGVEVEHPYSDTFTKDTCLTLEQLDGYLKGKDGYGWHISNLVIYDKPRELSEFQQCHKCKHNCVRTSQNIELCKYHRLTRPPQSWCYVEVS